ncbi:MAG TPA: NUDIX hydrolase [Burkholderiales bacterium]|nr:NUDIX hydrolase [Burkholderiales bacterium]
MSGDLHVTVAAVVEHNGKFLLVEEETEGGLRFNQPAGHLEAGESLLGAVARETLEETAYEFAPRHVIGVYRWQRPDSQITYVRFAFCGEVDGPRPEQALDTGIVRVCWLSLTEVRANTQRLRSPLVLRCIEDYLAGRRYPLELIHEISSK